MGPWPHQLGGVMGREQFTRCCRFLAGIRLMGGRRAADPRVISSSFDRDFSRLCGGGQGKFSVSPAAERRLEAQRPEDARRPVTGGSQTGTRGATQAYFQLSNLRLPF